jgi:hypothetical protein
MGNIPNLFQITETEKQKSEVRNRYLEIDWVYLANEQSQILEKL